jgi:hypothetical protein
MPAETRCSTRIPSRALRIFVAAITVCGMGRALRAQARVGASEGPSFEETTGWIASHLPESGYRRSETTQDRTYYPVQMSFMGCTWTFHTRYERFSEPNNYTFPDGMDGTISARELALAETRHLDIDGRVGIVVLKAQFGNRPALSGSRYRDWGEGLKAQALSGAEEVAIFFRDATMADRMATAFSRAISLCGGGKKELF